LLYKLYFWVFLGVLRLSLNGGIIMTIGDLFTLDSDLTDDRKIVYQGPVHMLAKKEGYQQCESDGKPAVGGYMDGAHWLYRNNAGQKVHQGELTFDIPSALSLLSEKEKIDEWIILTPNDNFPKLSFSEYKLEDVKNSYDNRGQYSSSKGALRIHLSAAIYGPKRYSTTNEIVLVGIEPGWMSAPPVWGNYDFTKKFLFVHYDYVLGQISGDKIELLGTAFQILSHLRSMVSNDVSDINLYSGGVVALKTNVQSHKEWALDHFVETLDRIVDNDMFKEVLAQNARLKAIQRASREYRFDKDVSFTVPEILSCIEDPLKNQIPHTLEEFKAQSVWHYYRPALERLREVVEKNEDMKKLINLI